MSKKEMKINKRYFLGQEPSVSKRFYNYYVKKISARSYELGLYSDPSPSSTFVRARKILSYKFSSLSLAIRFAKPRMIARSINTVYKFNKKYLS